MVKSSSIISGDRLGTNRARSAARDFGSSYTFVVNCMKSSFSIISWDSLGTYQAWLAAV